MIATRDEVQQDAIQSELDRIVCSSEFASSPTLVRLLRYCVKQSRAGNLESLKESVIGVNVFGRAADYNPKADPIVRVHARRLREKLNAFYSSEGMLDIVIQVPKGAYVARFQEAPPREAQEPAHREGGAGFPVCGPVPGSLRRTLVRLSAAVLVLIVTALAWRPLRHSSALPIAQPLVSLPGSAGDPAWSPDGSALAFTWDGGGSTLSSVYLLKNGETAPQKLTQSKQPEYRPVWSPDRTAIALLRGESGSHFAIVLVDLRTKRERVLRFVAGFSWGPILPALDWSSSGEWLVTSEQPQEPAAPAHLLLVSPSDGRSWVITDPPNGSTGDVEARFTPDSRRILFRHGGHGELLMLSLNGTVASMPAELTHGNAGIRGVSVSRDGQTIYFGGQQEYAKFGIWRIRQGDPAPVRITQEGIEAISPAIDPLGRSLAFVQPAADLNLWLYDTRSSNPPRLLASST